MSTHSYANQAFADQAHEAFRAEREQKRDDAVTAAHTRTHLETPAGPVPNDDAPTTVAETDGGEPRRFLMTEDRRVGSMAIPVDGHGSIRFAKPSGRASMGLLDPIEAMEDNGEMTDLGTYLWATLADWSLEDEHDEDFWADELGLLDAIRTLRSVALGGNPQTL